MNITEMTTEQLQAMAYQEIVIQQNSINNLRMIEQELAKKHIEPIVKPTNQIEKNVK